MRYIDADDFIKNKRKLYCEDCDNRKGMINGKPTKICYEIGSAPCRSCGINDMLDAIEDYPTADVEEVRHGEWIEGYGRECSCCGYWGDFTDDLGQQIPSNYCPNCGAKMDGGDSK